MTQQSRAGAVELTYNRQASLDLSPGGNAVYLSQNTSSSSPIFHSITYQLQNSTLLKTLAIIFFFLACVSHSLLIYQLSIISQQHPLFLSMKSSPLTTNNHPSSSSPPSAHLPNSDSPLTKKVSKD